MKETWRCLRFAVGPAAVLTMALVVFEVAGFDLVDFARRIEAACQGATAPDASDPARAAAVLRGRVLWASDVVLFLASAGAVGVAALSILRSLASASARRWLWTGFAVLLGLELIAGLSQLAPVFTSLYSSTADALQASLPLHDAAPLLHLARAAFAVNLVAACVPALGVIGGCACTLERGTADGSELADVELRMSRLDQLVQLGSAMLATGVLHVFLWLRLPADLPGVGDALGASIESTASAVSLFWGAAYSAVIAAWYIPASRAISSAGRAAAQRHRDQIGGVEPEEWLKKRGLSGSSLSKLPQFAAMLGPLLAGPAGALVSELAKSLA